MIERKKQPYLSIVITSRNDNHGGSALDRMRVSFSSLIRQLNKHRIESELILVDWNPVVNAIPLRDAIDWESSEYCTVRNIIVPSEIHQRYEHADAFKIHAAVAINCGIRRARGRFILPGVIDLLYPDDVMSFIASRKLKEYTRYRVVRCDVENAVLAVVGTDAQIEFCRNHIIEFQHQRKPWFIRLYYLLNNMPILHTNACGDFQLMSRHYWNILRGYSERDIAAGSVDGLLSYASYAAGVKEEFLDNLCVYHISHGGGFLDRSSIGKLPMSGLCNIPFVSNEFKRKLLRAYWLLLGAIGYRTKLFVNGVQTMDSVECFKKCKDMINHKCSHILNGESWGLGNEILDEFRVITASWETI